MPKPRSPNREKAFEIYKNHNGHIGNRRIAEMLNTSERSISGWKCKDKWESRINGVLQSEKRSTPRARGGQPGNKNAKGHGGTGPPGNKNAVKTGEFETLFFDTLDPDERQLINTIQLDKEQLLLQEIQLLTVRERRMLKRIEDVKKTVDYLEDESEAEGMTMVSRKVGIKEDKLTDLKEYRGKLGQIQSIEEALTRVQARKQRAIEALHKFGYDDARLEIEMIKVELVMLKDNTPEQETEDDGFMDAMNAEALEIWGDEDA